MKRILTSVVLMALTQLAGAQCGCGSTAFNCTVSSGDTVCITPTFNSGTGKWDLSIAATADGGNDVITVTIDANTNETAVGTVSISNTAISGTPNVLVDLRVTLKGTSGTTNLDSVDAITQAETATGKVTLVLLVTEEGVGSIAVNEITTVNVGGNLTGNVVATTGNIGTLTVGGSIGGGVVIGAAYGRIDLIDVFNGGGDLGASGNLATISCRDELRILRVADDVWADITVLNSSTYGPIGFIDIGGSYLAGDLHFDEFDALSGVSTPGMEVDDDVAATITLEGTLDHDLLIRGDLSAPLTIDVDLDADLTIEGNATSKISLRDLGNMSPSRTGNLTIGTNAVTTPITPEVVLTGSLRRGTLKTWQPFAGLINIANSIDSPGTIHFEDGFSGQTIINSSNVSGTWSGIVKYGTSTGTTISGPYYTTDPSAWGEGAVGLVKFNLFDEECSPPNGDVTGPTPFGVTLAFYGPVTCASGFPFLVEYLDGSTWIDDSAQWQIETGLGTRTLFLLYTDITEPSIIPGDREYRITPFLTGSNALLCADLLTTGTVPAEDFTYTFFTP